MPYVPGLLSPAVPQALRGLAVEYVDVSADYADLFRQQWTRRESLIVIEQDVIPWPGAIAAISACPSPWCAYGYDAAVYQSSAAGVPLGCAKLGAALMHAVPDLWAGAVPWDYCDGHLQDAAEAAGFAACLHAPPVTHLAARHPVS